MADLRSPLALAAGIGFIAGMRSMAAPALVSRHLAGAPGRGPAARLLSLRGAAPILAALAAAEMAADKTASIPDRTEPVPVAGRALMGALSGAAVAGGRSGTQAAGALVGAAAAVGATFLAYTVRTRAGRHTGLPNVALGLAEDALALTLGARLASAAALSSR